MDILAQTTQCASIFAASVTASASPRRALVVASALSPTAHSTVPAQYRFQGPGAKPHLALAIFNDTDPRALNLGALPGINLSMVTPTRDVYN